ncbi:hypothetical protein SNE40_013027 [Patella caerulea]|uniref:Uncharacterized protein n=1 Tax=Patella caerulea TaxID=87958 RepID=A0AAN8JLH5_PATCE
MPVFLSMFVALRQMSSLPIEGFKEGGIFWFTDLSIPDPVYCLPMLTVATLAATIEVNLFKRQHLSMGVLLSVRQWCVHQQDRGYYSFYSSTLKCGEKQSHMGST